MRAAGTNSRYLLSLAVVLGSTANGQSFQKALDFSSENPNIVVRTICTSDSGALMLLDTDIGLVHWKANANGEPQWMMQYPLVTKNLVRMPDGGVAFSDHGVTIFDLGDTTLGYLVVSRADAWGVVQWSKLLTTYVPNIASSFGWANMASDASGNILVSRSFETQNSHNEWFCCLSGSGETLWSKTYQMNANTPPIQLLSSDGVGGWFYASFLGGDSFRMGRLTSTGEATWYRRYKWYDPLGTQFEVGALEGAQGQAVIAGGLASDGLNGLRWFIMKADFDGSIEWFRLYYAYADYQMYYPGILQLAVLPDGGLLAGNDGHDVNYLFRTDSEGDVLYVMRQDTIEAGPYAYVSSWGDWDLRDTVLTVGSQVKRLVPGTIEAEYRPGLWQLSASTFNGCLTTPDELYSFLAQQTEVLVLAFPISPIEMLTTIADTSLTGTPVDAYSTTDYCALLTGVTEQSSTTEQLHVRPTLLLPGDFLLITGPHDGWITAIDAHGRTIARIALQARNTSYLSTADWRPGLYLLHGTDDQGHPVGAAKVIVE